MGNRDKQCKSNVNLRLMSTESSNQKIPLLCLGSKLNPILRMLHRVLILSHPFNGSPVAIYHAEPPFLALSMQLDSNAASSIFVDIIRRGAD